MPADSHKKMQERLAILERENQELRHKLAQGGTPATLLEATDQKAGPAATLDMYRSIVETTQQGVWVVDASFTSVYVNQRMAEMLGRPPRDILGRSLADFLFPEDLADHQLQMELRRQGHFTHYERRLRRQDGSELWTLVAAAPLREGQANLGSFALYTDMTEQRQAQAALRRSESFNRSLVEHLPQRIFLKDINSTYLSCNRQYARDLGREPDQVVGKDDFAFYPHELAEKYRADDGEVIRTGQVMEMVENYLVQGEERWINITKVPFRDGRGQVVGVLGIFDDITQRKLAEEGRERRISALTRPRQEVENIAFGELFNLEDIQRIQDEFAQATGVASLITTPDGSPITQPSQFSRLCSQLVRPNPLGEEKCRRSDMEVGRHVAQGPTLGTCFSAGLWNAGAGITVGGRHIANWAIGQVRDPEMDPERIKQYARDLEVDPEEFLRAYMEVPIMPRERFQMVANALFSLAKQLSTTAYQNIQQARFIAEKEKAEKALSDSEQSLSQIIEFLPDATFVIDRQGRVISWNKAMEDLTGIPKEEILGQGDYAYAIPFYGVRRPVSIDLVLAGDTAVQSTYHTFRQSGDTIYSETRLPDLRGRGPVNLWNTASLLRNASGQVVGAIESIRDVTDRWQVKEALKSSRQRYRELMDSVNDLIFTQDLEGRFTSFNAAVSKLLGFQPHELLGRQASSLMKPEFQKVFQEEYLEEIKTKREAKGISLFFHKDGGKRYLDYHCQLAHEPGGAPYISGIARDVSERVLQERRLRQLQDQLLQTQKMEAVGTLAGGIAHDFNNLLAAILGYAELAQQAALDRRDSLRSIEHIIAAAERARRLVRKILTFSRKMEIDQRPLDLNRVVVQTLDILERTLPKMIKIETKLDNHLDLVNADVSQMEQILLNLAGNAGDAMPQGGRLLIETQNVTLGPEYCRDHLEVKPGRYVQLMVSDTGQGMDQKTQARIFEPFFTTKGPGKGTGLGLATVYGITASHGGSIYCYSEPGIGTSFKLFLPVLEAGAQAVDQDADLAETMVGGDETILLVDDESALREVGSLTLQNMGYEVHTAGSGEEALERFGQMDPRPDLVILDLGMPGMGGRNCMLELLGRQPDLKVIIASGYSANGQVQQSLASGAAAFIAKPFRLAELIGTVRKVLDQAPA